MLFKMAVCGGLMMIWSVLYADEAANHPPESIESTELASFFTYAPKVQTAIELLLTLARQNLTYQYASADPRVGGMDCSGTIFYVLTTLGIKDVPRSADLQYEWVTAQGQFYPVPESAQSIDAPEFAHLYPGDLLFWSGTYSIARSNNVTHVMMYIGRNQAGQPLMAGASNGRTYQGRKIDGVSVFDFKVPEKESRGHLLGYGCVPHLNCEVANKLRP